MKGTWVFDTAHEGWNEIHPIKECQLVAKASWLRADVVDWEAAIAPYLVAIGRWNWDATDPMHLKPVKTDGPPKPSDWTDWVKSWCDHVATTSSAVTIDNQARPENKWEVHPEVDGCRPTPSDPPPGGGLH